MQEYNLDKQRESEEKRKRLIVPGFIEDPDMEDMLHNFIELAKTPSDYLADTMAAERSLAEEALQDAIVGDTGRKLREYLKPYLEKKNFPRDAYDVRADEFDRWYAADVFRSEQKYL